MTKPEPCKGNCAVPHFHWTAVQKAMREAWDEGYHKGVLDEADKTDGDDGQNPYINQIEAQPVKSKIPKKCPKYGNDHWRMGMGVCDECGYSNL